MSATACVVFRLVIREGGLFKATHSQRPVGSLETFVDTGYFSSRAAAERIGKAATYKDGSLREEIIACDALRLSDGGTFLTGPDEDPHNPKVRERIFIYNPEQEKLLETGFQKVGRRELKVLGLLISFGKAL